VPFTVYADRWAMTTHSCLVLAVFFIFVLVTTMVVFLRCVLCCTHRDTVANPLALLCMAFVGVANFFGMNIILAVGQGAVSPVRRLHSPVPTLVMFSVFYWLPPCVCSRVADDQARRSRTGERCCLAH
jgi:hypothetical protein